MLTTHAHRPATRWWIPLVLVLTLASAAGAQTNGAQASEPKPSMTVYGFAMLDIGQNFTSIHPDWFDTMRVSKLPSFDRQYGDDGSTFAGVRQTRFGVRTSSPTSMGELKTQFEFELFGTGVDSGQTTFRLRHAYGELGQFGAGQTWSPFMDPDVFPNSLEYLGPDGHGVLPQRAGPLDADQGGHQPDPGAGTPGRER